MTDHPIDADAAKLLLDDPALDRIIAEVGETIIKPDRDVLRHDLLICYGRYSIYAKTAGGICSKSKQLWAIISSARSR